MKKIFIFLFFVYFSITGFTQTTVYQHGVARELNSDKQPISGVFIKFEDAVNTNSDDAGNFRLSFQDKKAGDLIFLEEIKKSGYELVNKKDFEVTNISNTDRITADIILAKAGVVDASKKEYYGVSDQALLAGFEKEKNTLKTKLKASKLNQEEYLNKVKTLQEQYDIQKESLDALAGKFARINFDDVEPVFKVALKLFKAGKVTEAIAALESTNPTQRTAEIIREEKRLTAAQADLDEQKAKLAADKKKQIAAVRLLADMYGVNFSPEKAEAQYDQLLLLDSTNLEILSDAEEFYRQQHLYDKAKNTNKTIAAHPKVKEWQKANAYGFLGEMHTATGSLPNAMEAYRLTSENYKKLHISNPNHTFYKENLAISYQYL